MTAVERAAIELRCPDDPRVLFLKILDAGLPPVITPENLLELSCRSCKRVIAVREGKKPQMVLHRFDISGSLIETSIVW